MAGIIQIDIGLKKVPVKAIIRGDFAIHQEYGVKAKRNGKRKLVPVYAVTHIPTGYQVDNNYYSPLPLRAAVRYLAACQWPSSVSEIRENARCKLDAIQAMELAERGAHWAMRRDFTEKKTALTAQIQVND